MTIALFYHRYKVRVGVSLRFKVRFRVIWSGLVIVLGPVVKVNFIHVRINAVYLLQDQCCTTLWLGKGIINHECRLIPYVQYVIARLFVFPFQDVEANTVRLKEHGQDSLVLEKIPTNTQHSNNNKHHHVSYR